MTDDQFNAIVEDMTHHVGAQVHQFVQRAGMTMPTAGSAAAMGALVAADLALDMAIFTALSVFDEDWSGEQDVKDGFDEVFDTITKRIALNRENAWQRVLQKIGEKRAAAA